MRSDTVPSGFKRVKMSKPDPLEVILTYKMGLFRYDFFARKIQTTYRRWKAREEYCLILLDFLQVLLESSVRSRYRPFVRGFAAIWHRPLGGRK